MAITEAKKGKDVKLYFALADEFARIAPEDPLALVDTAWMEKRNRETKFEMDKLEHELKSYKNNLIKESIRVYMTHTCLFDRLVIWWSLTEAFRWVMKTSATSTTPLEITPTHTKHTGACENTAHPPSIYRI
jgi:hypothetical protein